MTPGADVNICYICNDKRRTADTDASVTHTGPHADSETLKQTLIRALSLGHVEDTLSGLEEESRLNGGLCVVSLSSRYDGGLEAVSDRVAEDHVVICRRCTGLLKDFEHHERMAARKAEEIRRFLMRQMEAEEEGSSMTLSLGRKPQSSLKLTVARTHDERQGIMAAFRAFRKSGTKSVRKRGRKRKKDSASPDATMEEQDEEAEEEEEEEEDDDSLDQNLREEPEEEERQQEVASARHSERIQRRREDGLVMRWGDALYENEDDLKLLDEDDLFDYSPDLLLKDRSYVRRGRGRKLTHVVRSTGSTSIADDEMGFKFQCPFCFRYYTPMNSRIHNCTSYKNQLRCHACNIFFTSYIRLEKHLEVIHLKQRQLACSMGDCNFTCIAEPTLTIHKHFHVLESFSREDSRETREAELKQQRIDTQQEALRNEVVTVEDDEQGVVTSPGIADRVSFLLDEKSFLSDGHPLNITTDRAPKDDQDDCKILRFQGDDKNQERSTSPSSRPDMGTESPEKSERKSHKGYSLVLQCPICDITLVSTRSYQEHIREVHHLRVTTRITGDDRASKEIQKRPGSESLLRIVKYYNVKKNSIATRKGLD